MRVYIDDMVIFSSNWENHLKHLAEVFCKLEDAGLKANMVNCQWGTGVFEFLGHVVGKGKISPAQCKTHAIQDNPCPK